MATLITLVTTVVVMGDLTVLLFAAIVGQARVLVDDIDQDGFVLDETLADAVEKIEDAPVVDGYEFDEEKFTQDARGAVAQVIRKIINVILNTVSSLPQMIINLFIFVGILVMGLPRFDKGIGSTERRASAQSGDLRCVYPQGGAHDSVSDVDRGIARVLPTSRTVIANNRPGR